MDAVAIGKKLVDLRGKKSQTEVAKALGMSISAISMYETGERIPRDETREQIAKYYNMSVGALFFDEKVHDTCTDELEENGR